jgi:hypothetical protein|tara:strand:- start:597 stop:1109 length:513 start_codon:yes stop_codon:yes gene_type:complete
MKKFKIAFLVILLNVLMIKAIEACDLLSVNIGGDKSTINFFGVLDDEDIDEDDTVTIFESTIDPFCTDIDFGNVILKMYITAASKIAAVEIVVQNADNEESKKGLLKAYAESNFGNLDMESEEWNGYKFWDIGSKLIYYYLYERDNQPTSEGIAITSKRYYPVLASDQYE